jgi:hypothetical protein
VDEGKGTVLAQKEEGFGLNEELWMRAKERSELKRMMNERRFVDEGKGKI